MFPLQKSSSVSTIPVSMEVRVKKIMRLLGTVNVPRNGQEENVRVRVNSEELFIHLNN